MRQRVVPGNRGDRPRVGDGQRRIENRDPEGRLRIAAGHLLVGLGVGNDRVALRLAPRSRRRRHADGRQHRPRSLAESPIVAHRAAVGQHEVDALGAIERAAAPERHERIDRTRGGGDAPGLDHAAVGVGVELVKARRPRCRRSPARRSRDPRGPPATRPGSATSRVRVKPSSRARSPSRASESAPKTTRGAEQESRTAGRLPKPALIDQRIRIRYHLGVHLFSAAENRPCSQGNRYAEEVLCFPGGRFHRLGRLSRDRGRGACRSATGRRCEAPIATADPPKPGCPRNGRSTARTSSGGRRMAAARRPS